MANPINNVMKLFQSSNGSVGIIFAIAVIPLALAAGIAVDFSQASNVRASLQNLADAAVLAGAASINADDETRKEMARLNLELNLKKQHVGVVGEPVFSIVDGELTLHLETNLETRFMRLAGYTHQRISTDAAAVVAELKKAEVALVLDYSGSMNGKGKYQAMRDAAIDMINTVAGDADTSGAVKFGLVPFSHHVYLSLPGEYVVDGISGTTWTNCTQDRKSPYNIEDSAPDASNIDTLWGMSKTNGYGNGAYAVCNSYVNNDLIVMPLTDDVASVRSQLNKMQPHNLTHIALGTEFGWALLSPDAPFTEGAAYDDKETEKYLVILTDGVQTEKAWGLNKSRSVQLGEANLEAMCTNIKSAGIKIISIAFDLNDTWTEARLRACASSNDDFHNADDNAELSLVFKDIAKKLVKTVRLSK